MKLGVIGGSGLYDMADISGTKSIKLNTPFGKPSDAYVRGMLGPTEIFFLPRHGRGHRITPSEINYRANIYGFKTLGVERIVSISAVGSLKEEYRPGDMVLPDQYFDRTKSGEDHTFFGKGIVAHVQFADPTCPELRKVIAAAAREVIARQWEKKDARVAEGGVYVNMEGPAFSTRAESKVYRHMGFDIIGMTSLREAKLCREAEICYQAAALVTDYDCWHETEEAVSVEMLIQVLLANTRLAQLVLRRLVDMLPKHHKCACGSALSKAIVTDPGKIPAAARKRLAPIVGKYLR